MAHRNKKKVYYFKEIMRTRAVEQSSDDRVDDRQLYNDPGNLHLLMQKKRAMPINKLARHLLLLLWTIFFFSRIDDIGCKMARKIDNDLSTGGRKNFSETLRE